MGFYKLDHTAEEGLKNTPTQQQTFLKKYLNADFSKREAKYLWERIADHKWYVSERLKRDIGFHVAAVDYIENFYAPVFFSNRQSSFKNSVLEFFKIIARTEFLRPKSL